MLTQQTTDLGAGHDDASDDRHGLLAHLDQITSMEALGGGRWSDDHRLHVLVTRYEHASWGVGSQLLGIADR